jgi:hypothetical protein
MDPIEEKVLTYLKAGFSKKEIFEKISRELAPEDNARAKEIVEKNLSQKSKSSKTKLLIISGAAGIFLLITLIIIYFSFINNSQFVSSKCLPSVSIKIEGDTVYRDKSIEVLRLMEDKNCGYLGFVGEHTPKISSGMLGIFVGGQYEGGNSAKISTFTGDTYYVAAIMVHEACHSYQAKLGKGSSEPDCTLTQYHFLQSINAPQKDLDHTKKIGEFYPEYSFNESNKDVFLEWMQNKK